MTDIVCTRCKRPMVNIDKSTPGCSPYHSECWIDKLRDDWCKAGPDQRRMVEGMIDGMIRVSNRVSRG